MKIVNRNHISTHISFIIFMGFPLDDANNMKIHVLCTNSSLLHQLKFVVDRVLEVKLNFSKEQQQFFYVLPNLMIFPISSIHYPTESITYFRLIEIKFWKSVFKIVINSGNSKVSNFYTQQHCILLILYIYFYQKPILTDDLYSKK